MADETLVYSAKFDPTGLNQGLAQADAALEKLDSTAARVFTDMAKNASKASTAFSSSGGSLGFSDAQFAKEKTGAERNAEYLKQWNERRNRETAESLEKRKAITEAKEEEIYRMQARREEEFATAKYQADLAAAGMYRQGWEKKVAIQRVMMQKELSEFAGNLEAQEQIQRKHNAIIASIETEKVMSGDRPNRVILQRLGTVTAAANRAQGVLFGVSPLLGNLGGGLAQTAAGFMGISTAMDAVAASGKTMIVSLTATLGVLAAVGIAVALVVKQKKEMQALRDNPDWLGDPAKFDSVTAALKRYTDAEAAVAKLQSDAKNSPDGAARLYTELEGLIDAAAVASRSLQKETGMTADEAKKFIAQFKDGKGAVDSFFLVTQARLVAVRNELKRAQIDGQSEGLEKSLAQEKQRADEAVQNEKATLAAIMLDTKKSAKEKEQAKRTSDSVIEELEKVHQQNVLNIQAEARSKREEEERKEYDRQLDDLRKRQKDALQVEQEIIAREIQIVEEARKTRRSEDTKFLEARAQTESEALIVRQQLERRALDSQIQSYQFMENEVLKSAAIQTATEEKLIQKKRQTLEVDRAIRAEQAKLLQSSLTLGMTIAIMFNNSRAQRYLGQMQQYLTLLNQIRMVSASIAALGLFSTGGASAVATPAQGGGGFLKTLLGFADGGMISGRNTIIKANESGREAILNPRGVEAAGGPSGINALNSGMGLGKSGISIGDVHITVGAGAEPAQISRAVTSGIVAAARQLEGIRGARYYENGTLKV